MLYIAHRLFAAHDRALGAMAARILGDAAGNDDNVFLPFCDTDEEDLVADVKGRRLFELDSERLKRLSGMLALLHGPSLDDGVCMEIGFAAALGVPVVALTTDFITYATEPDAPGWSFPDPLIDYLATDVISARMLGTASAEPSQRFTAFEDRNRAQVADAMHAACRRLVGLAQPTQGVRAMPADSQRVAFIESSPYRPSSDDGDGNGGLLRELGYQVITAGRFSARDPLAAAAADWTAATSASLLIADVSGPEAPPGAAAMIGAAVATGRTALAYNPVPAWTFAHGREPNWRNLMIQYGVSGVFSAPADLKGLVRQ
ncbi:nucleoside 2-deoxyribosyltransferase [Catenulispora pinisilvae]|uniref:nucleoside 2-deoxyribosyltransferase n=1 Tax=Catenulispora pinisilvae TaxID=2705253 RepID=UPI0018910EB9|nr:nucleoside 2-deoxyribosyltransferase [Catenulispora pinisilvae]